MLAARLRSQGEQNQGGGGIKRSWDKLLKRYRGDNSSIGKKLDLLGIVAYFYVLRILF